MKVTLIGGGSYNWAPFFCNQFIESEKLSNVTITLMDIDEFSLNLVGSVVDKINKAKGSTVKIITTTDLNSALDGADFVFVSISTGGFSAMQSDIEIPEKYGIYHTVGDTVGPGGWLRAVRNIPVFRDIAERMKKLCPNAWLINVTNPLSPLTRVVDREFGIKTFGMCPGVEKSINALAKLAGANPNGLIDLIVTGIDHGSWFTKLWVDGIDVIEKLKEKGFYRSDDKLPYVEGDIEKSIVNSSFRAAFAVWREIGHLPSIADRHCTENWPWFLLKDGGDLDFGIQRTSIANRKAYRQDSENMLLEFVKTDDELPMHLIRHRNDPVVSVVAALSGVDSFKWEANYKNIGQIEGIPLGAVVETRCLFDKDGIHPYSSPMPNILKIITLPHVLRQEDIIDIALQGTFDELAALVLTDPLCSKLQIDEPRKMVKEMLNANKHLIQNPKLLD